MAPTEGRVASRDAPIIGIGRLLCWYRPIVIYYAYVL